VAINQTAFPNIATPTLKKTSLSFKNFGANSNGVSPVEKLSARVKQVEITNDALVSQNRDFQSSIANINNRIGALESGQKAILDFQKDKAKIEKKQRELEEQRIKKEGAEGALEKDDADAIKKTDGSVEKKGKESVGFLEGIKKFFMFTIAGWFADKSMKLINAFASGNKDAINSIGKKLLGGLAAVGSLMLIAAAGIGPVLAGIGSLIGVLAGLLFNPVTLTALLIAVGIGGAIMGIRALWKWGRNKATGGQKFTDRHKELDKKLRDAGMTSKGLIVNESGMGKHTNRTPEQEKLFQEVEAERAKLNATKKSMQEEVDAARKQWKKDAIANRDARGDKKVDWKTENAKWKEQEAAIRKKYTDTITPSASSGNFVKSNVNTSDVTSKIGPEPNNEGNISVVPIQKEVGMPNNSASGTATTVDYIPSENSGNSTWQAKSQYGVVG
tara:strand:- start:485 stop:1816 length:1332 start_codon:yes stop_codon:yes gene_type:complete